MNRLVVTATVGVLFLRQASGYELSKRSHHMDERCSIPRHTPLLPAIREGHLESAVMNNKLGGPAILIALGVLLPAPAGSGDATHFMICRSDGCIDLPSLRFMPKAAAPAPAPPPPAQPAPDTLSREIEADIVEFCSRNPGERFCGKLQQWFQQHPEAGR
jgi:hypothetical protein